MGGDDAPVSANLKTVPCSILENNCCISSIVSLDPLTMHP